RQRPFPVDWLHCRAGAAAREWCLCSLEVRVARAACRTEHGAARQRGPRDTGRAGGNGHTVVGRGRPGGPSGAAGTGRNDAGGGGGRRRLVCGHAACCGGRAEYHTGTILRSSCSSSAYRRTTTARISCVTTRASASACTVTAM